MPRPCLVSWQEDRPDVPILLCLPPAGSGAGQFRFWQERLGPALQVIGVQLPGREERWTEPHPSSVDEAVAGIVAELWARVDDRRGLVVYGHSFGGLLGYEVLRVLDREHGVPARSLVIAACRAPHLWSGAGRTLLDEVDGLGRLLAARQPPGLDDEDGSVWLDVLRKDAELSLSYRVVGPRPVRCPIVVWGGDRDTLARPDQLDGWRSYTTAEFASDVFPGDHYFHETNTDVLLDRLTRLAYAHHREEPRHGHR